MPQVYDRFTGRMIWIDDNQMNLRQIDNALSAGPEATWVQVAQNGYTPVNQQVLSQQVAAVPPRQSSSGRDPWVQVSTGARSFAQAAADQSKASAPAAKSASSTTSRAAPTVSSATTTSSASAPATSSSSTTRSSDGLVSSRNGRRVDSLGNYALSTGGGAAAPVAPALGPPTAQPDGVFGYGTDPFVSGEVPLPPGQFYPTDVFVGGGNPGAYAGMPWMQQAQFDAGGGQFFGPGGGSFPGPGSNLSYWPNMTDPQVQRNLAVLNSQFPWVELQESTRRDNRNFFEQARNNLFNRRASAYQVGSRALLPNVREIG